MIKDSLLVRISKKYRELTPSEKKVADYIVANPEEGSELTINALSIKCDTSITTITRFTKKLGVESFFQLKLQLSREFNNIYRDSEKLSKEELSIRELSLRVLDINQKIILEQLNSVSEHMLLEGVDAILKAKNIYFFGVGASTPLALEAWWKFSRLGINCIFSQEFHAQLLSTKSIKMDDLAIIFSHSGVNKDILYLGDLIKERGVPSIGITLSEKSPLEKLVQKCICFSNNTVQRKYPYFSSRIPLMYVIEIIYQIIVKRGEREGTLSEYQEFFKKRNI